MPKGIQGDAHSRSLVIKGFKLKPQCDIILYPLITCELCLSKTSFCVITGEKE